MRWTHLTLLGGALNFLSGASTSSPPSPNHILDAKFNMDTGAVRMVNAAAAAAHKRNIDLNNSTTPNSHHTPRFLTHHFNARQAGRCGADFGGQSCPDNQCCSSYGYCGTQFEFCGEIVGCQPDYGRCGEAPSPTPTPTPTPTPAPPSSSAPPPPGSSTVSPPLPSGTLIVSPDGRCGNSTTCGGSPFGDCCSEFYFCGSGDAYCGAGCRSGFGTCGGGGNPPPPGSSSAPPPPPPTSSTPPTPSSTAAPVPTNVSTDGRCGSEYGGKTCTGSTFGRCCSDYGWCGNQEDYCRPIYGCQPEWGTCV